MGECRLARGTRHGRRAAHRALPRAAQAAAVGLLERGRRPREAGWAGGHAPGRPARPGGRPRGRARGAPPRPPLLACQRLPGTPIGDQHMGKGRMGPGQRGGAMRAQQATLARKVEPFLAADRTETTQLRQETRSRPGPPRALNQVGRCGGAPARPWSRRTMASCRRVSSGACSPPGCYGGALPASLLDSSPRGAALGAEGRLCVA